MLRMSVYQRDIVAVCVNGTLMNFRSLALAGG